MVTMREVAARARVSQKTVSRVFNDDPHVRPETRERVRGVMRDLGYVANPIAGVFRSGRVPVLGIAVPDVGDPFFAVIVSAVDAVAREADMSTLVASLGHDPDREEDVVRNLLRRAPSGLFMTPVGSYQGYLDVTAAGLPVVFVDREPVGHDSDVIHHDDAAGVRLAVEHLIAAGHRVIGHLAGPSDWFDAQWRHATWEACLNDAGLTVPPVAMGDWHAQSGFEASDELLQIPDLTAVFAANDQMALGLIHGLSRRGVRVPEDISVVGFDDQPDCGHFLPPLTTVHQDFETLGDAGITAFLAQLDGAGDGVRHHVEPHLVVRSSTRPVLSR